MKIFLWILIIAVVVLVVIRKVKNIRRGKFCDCGCENCPSKCREYKETKD